MFTPLCVYSILCPFHRMFTPSCVHSIECSIERLSTSLYVHSCVCPLCCVSTPSCVHSVVCSLCCMYTTSYIHFILSAPSPCVPYLLAIPSRPFHPASDLAWYSFCGQFCWYLSHSAWRFSHLEQYPSIFCFAVGGLAVSKQEKWYYPSHRIVLGVGQLDP